MSDSSENYSTCQVLVSFISLNWLFYEFAVRVFGLSRYISKELCLRLWRVGGDLMLMILLVYCGNDFEFETQRPCGGQSWRTNMESIAYPSSYPYGLGPQTNLICPCLWCRLPICVLQPILRSIPRAWNGTASKMDVFY
jgi:hypothetical protein